MQIHKVEKKKNKIQVNKNRYSKEQVRTRDRKVWKTNKVIHKR